jgi:acetyl esterase/lipase
MTNLFDPELAPWLSMVPPLDVTDAVAARELLRSIREQQPAPELPEGVTVERRSVPGHEGDPDVDVLIYSPGVPAVDLPAIFYIHGGGFVLGDAESDSVLPGQLASELGSLIVSVDYRLAPEYPFPAGLRDCFAALEWTAKNASELGIDLDRLAIGGVSAGAGLAAAVSLLARDRGAPALCFQLLDIPELDDRLETGSMVEFVNTPVWNRPNAVQSWRHYLGERAESGEVSHYAAPARATNLSGLPPAYVSVCAVDPLRDEGIEYAQRLAQAGVPTELHLFPGTFHGSSGMIPTAGVSVRMRTELIEAARRGLQVG